MASDLLQLTDKTRVQRGAVVHNLTVRGTSTYFVGRLGAWVHNCWEINKYKPMLDRKHLDAARRELNGEVVARWYSSGEPINHAREVIDAMVGLRNRLEDIKKELDHLSNYDYSAEGAARQAELTAELSAGSRLLDYAQDWLR